MKKILAAAFLVLLFAADANANTGIFFGSGHTITLGKSEQVQLVSEDVTITPNCGWQPIADSVDYRCKFVLKNLTAKPVSIQVGFPLDSQFAREEKQPPATDLVLRYSFIARDDKTTYHVRFIPNDSEKKFSSVFLWDMAFDPAETRVLHVAYRLGMSQGVGTTNKDTMKKYEKPWHAALASCAVEHFYYVTETGKSWAGTIEHASFRVVIGSWEDCLQKRPVQFDGEPTEPKPNQQWWQYGFPLKTGSVYQHIEPEGWKSEHHESNSTLDTKTWEYRPYKAGPPIAFLYYIVAFPRTVADCESWVRHVLGPKPSKADLAELREIAAAFYGIAPKSASAKKFVEQQIWYHPKEGYRPREGLQEAPLWNGAAKPQAAKNMVGQRVRKDGSRETELDWEQQAVLASLDAIAKGCSH